jgi:hypothetical protein
VKQYNCPSCGGVIELDNVNVAKDIALCKRCGQTTSFAVLSGISELSSIKLDAPPKNIRINEDMPGVKVIRYKRFQPVLLFLIPFTCIWFGMVIGIMYRTQIVKCEFNMAESLKGLPFLLGGIVMTSIIIYLIFSKWLITLTNHDCSVFIGIGKLGWRRVCPLTRQTTVTLDISNASENNRPLKAVTIHNDSDNLQFGAFMTEQAKQYIAAFIAKWCSRI